MINVVLTIRGRQLYEDQEPEVVELVTEGTLTHRDGGWDICYEESPLTGLEGVKTSFFVQPGKITLTRTGRLRSCMVFEVGVLHESLYQMEFGTLLISVCALDLGHCVSEKGGTVELAYRISVENTESGIVEYFLEIKPAEA
jgi:uncharacterized beta-barrel protein YwiB (DUF1934 family)